MQTNITMESLTGDGSPYGKVDESLQHGIPVERCAQRILKAVAQKKREAIIAQPRESAALLLKRFLPGVLFGLVRKLDPLQ